MTNDSYCPVCGYDIYSVYHEPAWKGDSQSDNICPCCHIQYGYHDFGKTAQEREKRHLELRKKWIEEGMPWRDKIDNEPENWDPKKQLHNIGIMID
ncbi:MAG: hypothetical protein WC659_03690 [Patescibacteria group bacterium]